MSITLKVKKVKTTENDGKPDTYSVLLEGDRVGVEFALTIVSEDPDAIQDIIPTRPGAIIEMNLRPALYGNIESYASQAAEEDRVIITPEPPETLQLPSPEHTYMDPAEYEEIITALETIPEEPELKAPDALALIEELKDFDYSHPDESKKKVKERMKAAGYDLTGLDEALGMQADPYEGTSNAGKDPRETDQPEALEARRRAYKAEEEAVTEKRG